LYRSNGIAKGGKINKLGEHAMEHLRDHRAFAGVLIAFTLLLQTTPSAAQSSEPTGLPSAVIIVRHADKALEPASDPGLTAAGAKRAQDLMTALGDAGVTGIITTQMRRTRETAQPLAIKLGLVPEVVKIPADESGHVSRDLSAHLAALQATLRHYGGGVALVVGHDNSVPGLIAALGGPRLPDICGTVYDNLFIVSFPGKGEARLLRSRYGESTPDSECK
jgi:broad specificity phosphatase PhoE